MALTLAQKHLIHGIGTLGLGAGISPMVNILTGAALNFSALAGAANATQSSFKGTRLWRLPLSGGVENITQVNFGWCNWRMNGSNGVGVAEVSGAIAVPVRKAYLVLRNSLLGARGGAIITAGGLPTFTMPVSNSPFMFDPLSPASFGVANFIPGDFFEWRWDIPLSSGQNTYRSVSVLASRGWRYDPTNIIDDIYSDAPMTVGSGNTAMGVPFPNFALVKRSEYTGRSLALCGDSIMYLQNSQSIAESARLGASYAGQAAYQAGVPSLNLSIGGRTARGLLNSPLTLALAPQITDTAIISYLANDVAFGTPLATIESDYRTIAPMWSKRIAVNGLPRLTEGVSNSTNLYGGTDLSVMVPYITQATVAGGFPRDGYGFGSGETRDLWNTVTLPALLADGTINAIGDFASVVQDPTTTWKQAVPAYSATLQAGVSIGASSVSVSAAPPAGTNLIIEPGVSNVENVTGQGGPIAYSQTGAGPYTVTVSYTNSYSGATGQGVLIQKNHSSGVAVKATMSNDYTHPVTLAHETFAPTLAGLIGAL